MVQVPQVPTCRRWIRKKTGRAKKIAVPRMCDFVAVLHKSHRYRYIHYGVFTIQPILVHTGERRTSSQAQTWRRDSSLLHRVSRQ